MLFNVVCNTIKQFAYTTQKARRALIGLVGYKLALGLLVKFGYSTMSAC